MELIGQKGPGDKVNIIVNRDGKEMMMTLTMQGEDSKQVADKSGKITIQGATFEPLTEKEKGRLNIDYGFKITALTPGKLRSAGISAGFIVLTIDRKPIRNSSDLRDALSGGQGGVLLEGVYPNGLRAYYGIGI